MSARTRRFGEEPPESLEEFEDELPDDQVVRRFFATHERHHHDRPVREHERGSAGRAPGRKRPGPRRPRPGPLDESF